MTDSTEYSGARRFRAGARRRRPNGIGLALTVVAAVALIAWAAMSGAWGYATVLVVPIAIGVVVGRLIPRRIAWLLVVPVTVLALAMLGALTIESLGTICALVLFLVFSIPFTLGVLIGFFTGDAITERRPGYHRVVLAAGWPLVLGAALWLEPAIVGRQAVETVQTARVISVDIERAWDRLHFYEEVKHAPPWLARVGLPRPLYTLGKIDRVGDVKRCVWDKGRLVKRATKHEPPHLLAFDVIEQVGVEARSARLIDGSFRFEAIGPGETRVVLTTRYEPLLSARLVWRPFERSIAHALHEHVLEGIAREAAEETERSRLPIEPFPSVLTMNGPAR